MKKPRVTIETRTIHQIYVEHGDERFLYALTDKLERAKKQVQEAKREFGIAKPRKKKKSPQTP